MKEVLAIIRPNKVSRTKKALAEAGFPAFTCRKVYGRGKKPIYMENIDSYAKKTILLPKRAFTLMINDEDVEKVVDIIMKANCDRNPGDGKVFVFPLNEAYKISDSTCEIDIFK